MGTDILDDIEEYFKDLPYMGDYSKYLLDYANTLIVRSYSPTIPAHTQPLQPTRKEVMTWQLEKKPNYIWFSLAT